MRCSTVKSSVVPGDDPCQGTATHLLIASSREPLRDPVCKPCGESYVRRPALQARLVPLHTFTPPSAFIDTVEGHRLVADKEHEARCFDCGTTGDVNWFRFQTNGCPGRPESIEVLYHSKDMLCAELHERAAASAAEWWDYAVNFIGAHVGDWRLVTDDEKYSAFFTFRDREYGLRHDLPGGRFGAEPLPNRGRPKPEVVDGDLRDWNQAAIYFHDRATDSGSEYFATWTPGHAKPSDRELIILYTPEGQIHEVLYVPGLWGWDMTIGAICDAFGPLRTILLRTRIYA
ncbi:hypothetical protein ACWD7Y_04760 [Streptomyces drozdowiczii]